MNGYAPYDDDRVSWFDIALWVLIGGLLWTVIIFGVQATFFPVDPPLRAPAPTIPPAVYQHPEEEP